MVEPGTEQSPWTSELIEKVINNFTDLAKEFMRHKESEAEAKTKYIQATAHHNRWTLYTLIAFLVIVIAGMSYLTMLGRVSGDALLFLVGTVTGYVIILIQRLIFVFTPTSGTTQENSEN